MTTQSASSERLAWPVDKTRQMENAFLMKHILFVFKDMGTALYTPIASHLGELGSIPRRESRGTMQLVDGFSRVSPVSPPLNSGAAPYSLRSTLIGCQDLDVKSRPPHSTPSSFCNMQSINGLENALSYAASVYVRTAVSSELLEAAKSVHLRPCSEFGQRQCDVTALGANLDKGALAGQSGHRPFYYLDLRSLKLMAGKAGISYLRVVPHDTTKNRNNFIIRNCLSYDRIVGLTSDLSCISLACLVSSVVSGRSCRACRRYVNPALEGYSPSARGNHLESVCKPHTLRARHSKTTLHPPIDLRSYELSEPFEDAAPTANGRLPGRFLSPGVGEGVSCGGEVWRESEWEDTRGGGGVYVLETTRASKLPRRSWKGNKIKKNVNSGRREVARVAVASRHELPGCIFLRRYWAPGAAVAERLDCSPPTKANRAQYPAVPLPDSRTWESRRTMTLAGGFSRGSPVPSVLAFRLSLAGVKTWRVEQVTPSSSRQILAEDVERSNSDVFNPFKVTSNFSGASLKFYFQDFPPPRANKASGAGMQGRGGNGGTRENPASSSTTPTYENPGVNPPGIELGSALVGGERPNHCAAAYPGAVTKRAVTRELPQWVRAPPAVSRDEAIRKLNFCLKLWPKLIEEEEDFTYFRAHSVVNTYRLHPVYLVMCGSVAVESDPPRLFPPHSQIRSLLCRPVMIDTNLAGITVAPPPPCQRGLRLEMMNNIFLVILLIGGKGRGTSAKRTDYGGRVFVCCRRTEDVVSNEKSAIVHGDTRGALEHSRLILSRPTSVAQSVARPASSAGVPGSSPGLYEHDTRYNIAFYNTSTRGATVNERLGQLASHQGEPGSIPGRVTPGFSHAAIVSDEDAGRRVFSGISHFPRPFTPAQLHTRLVSLPSPLKTQTSSLQVDVSRMFLLCTTRTQYLHFITYRFFVQRGLESRWDRSEVSSEQGRNEWAGGGEREISEKTHQPASSSGTSPACENPEMTRLGIEPGSSWWEASSLTAQPPWPREPGGDRIFGLGNTTVIFSSLARHSGLARPYKSSRAETRIKKKKLRIKEWLGDKSWKASKEQVSLPVGGIYGSTKTSLKVKKRGSDTGHTNTNFLLLIAPTCKSWCFRPLLKFYFQKIPPPRANQAEPSLENDTKEQRTEFSWNYFPSIVTNFTWRMSLSAPVKIYAAADIATPINEPNACQHRQTFLCLGDVPCAVKVVEEMPYSERVGFYTTAGFYATVENFLKRSKFLLSGRCTSFRSMTRTDIAKTKDQIITDLLKFAAPLNPLRSMHVYTRASLHITQLTAKIYRYSYCTPPSDRVFLESIAIASLRLSPKRSLAAMKLPTAISRHESPLAQQDFFDGRFTFLSQVFIATNEQRAASASTIHQWEILGSKTLKTSAADSMLAYFTLKRRDFKHFCFVLPLSLDYSLLGHAQDGFGSIGNHLRQAGPITSNQVEWENVSSLLQKPIKKWHRLKHDKINFKRVYIEVTFAIGLEFIRHILDDSVPIADLQGNKERIPYCQVWGNTGAKANEQTSQVRLYKGFEVCMEEPRNGRAGETGDSRENPPTGTCENPGVTRPGIKRRFALVGGEQSNRSATTAPHMNTGHRCAGAIGKPVDVALIAPSLLFLECPKPLQECRDDEISEPNARTPPPSIITAEAQSWGSPSPCEGPLSHRRFSFAMQGKGEADPLPIPHPSKYFRRKLFCFRKAEYSQQTLVPNAGPPTPLPCLLRLRVIHVRKETVLPSLVGEIKTPPPGRVQPIRTGPARSVIFGAEKGCQEEGEGELQENEGESKAFTEWSGGSAASGGEQRN
ncbi:hypothetical protein PR048_028739 [Dryococelus australis]|uniref:Uncharacterized protein n=1 Tax=Dryococelus australis TaxID=614101 RepID=A0ABQ9GF77_9NEOP|nr:hypothetical protein PR048_028739 [Dryococelus australis]